MLLSCMPRHVASYPVLRFRELGAVHSIKKPSLRNCVAKSAHDDRQHSRAIAKASQGLNSVTSGLANAKVTKSQFDGEIIKLALPSFLLLCIEPVLQTVETGIVGHVGTSSLGGVGIANIMLSGVTTMFAFLMDLTTPLVADAVGQNDTKKAHKVVGGGLWLALICGVAMAALTGYFAPSLIGLQNPEPEVAVQAVRYFSLRLFALPAILLGFVAVGAFRANQDLTTPLRANGYAAFVILLLQISLVFGLHWGVTGAAVAFAVGQVLVFLALMPPLYKENLMKGFPKPPSMSDAFAFLGKGVVFSAGIAAATGVMVVAVRMLSESGTAAVAAGAVVRQVFVLVNTLSITASMVTQAVVAKYLGEGDHVRAKQALNRIMQIAVGVTVLLCTPMALFAPQITQLLSPDPAVMEQALAPIVLIGLTAGVDAAGTVVDAALVASKQTNYSAVINMASSVIILGVLFYLGSNHMLTVITLFCALKLMPVLRTIIGAQRVWFSDKTFKPTPVESRTE